MFGKANRFESWAPAGETIGRLIGDDIKRASRDAGVSVATLRRYTIGEQQPCAQFLRRIAERWPLTVSAAVLRRLFCGTPIEVRRRRPFDPDFLDLDGDGDADLHDARLHRAYAARGQADLVLFGDQATADGKVDTDERMQLEAMRHDVNDHNVAAESCG